MSTKADRTVDRTGAVPGVAAVVLLLAIFMVLPALPAPDESIGAIAEAAKADQHSLLAGAYVGSLMGLALLVFGASLAAALKRAEGDEGGWWILAVVGIAATSIGIVADAAVITFVRAVGHGVSGDALWVGYGLDHWLGVLLALPLGLFVVAVSLGSRSTGLLPRWLGWGGVAVAVLLVLGGASVIGDEVSGGVLGLPLFVGYLLLLVWIVGASIRLWRGTASNRAPAPVTRATTA